MSDACYLCGATANLTRDHVPPQGFFPKPLPQNLITVPCCLACNQSWQKEDEAIRAFFSAAIGRSKAGDIIWEERVILGTVARSPRFREYMLGSVWETSVTTPFDIEPLSLIELPQKRIEPFMERLTKGLLRFYYPDYDYSNSIFRVRNIPCTEQNLQVLETHLVGTKYDERGDGVIRYRHGISDTGLSGVWFYMFYDAVWYLVLHERRTATA